MERFQVPIMADSLLSAIATFHTTNIIVTHESIFQFLGSIQVSMYASVSPASKLIQDYKKCPSSGPREPIPDMIKSIEEADKPETRGKKQRPTKGNTGISLLRVQSPPKRKAEMEAPSQPKKKKVKKPARKLIL